MTQTKEKDPAKSPFATSMRVKGNSVNEFWNNLTGEFFEQQRDIALEMGRPVSLGEISIYECVRCGDVNECTCGD